MIEAIRRWARKYIPVFRKRAERAGATALMDKLQQTVEATSAKTADKLPPRKDKVKE